jgi:predicted flap endonuclease-1-like 5' DNA nuclease
MAKIIDVEGIGEQYGQKLIDANIKTTKALLSQGASEKGRKAITEKTGIREDLILTWVNHADLYRIKGVGSEYSELLECAGVDSVPELAQRNPEHLYEKLVELNNEKKLVRRLPLKAQVMNWVTQAKHLPRVVTH